MAAFLTAALSFDCCVVVGHETPRFFSCAVVCVCVVCDEYECIAFLFSLLPKPWSLTLEYCSAKVGAALKHTIVCMWLFFKGLPPISVLVPSGFTRSRCLGCYFAHVTVKTGVASGKVFRHFRLLQRPLCRVRLPHHSEFLTPSCHVVERRG